MPITSPTAVTSDDAAARTRRATPAELLGQRDLAGEDGTSRAFDRKSGPGADDAQRAAAQLDGDRIAGDATVRAGRRRRDRRAGAARERLAAAALERALGEAVAAEHLHELDVDAARERGVHLQCLPDAEHVGAGDVVDEQHGVRIAG